MVMRSIGAITSFDYSLRKVLQSCRWTSLKNFVPRLKLRTKIILLFIAVLTLSFAFLGYFSIINVSIVGQLAEENSFLVSKTSTTTGISALEKLTKELLRNKALDIASQIRKYDFNPNLTYQEISKDILLERIAVQTIGKTGYTFLCEETNLCDIESALVLVHNNRELIGSTLHDWRERGFSWHRIEINGDVLTAHYFYRNNNSDLAEGIMCAIPVFRKNYLIPVYETDQISPDKKFNYIVVATLDKKEFLETAQKMQDEIELISSHIRTEIVNQEKQTRIISLLVLLVMLGVATGLTFLLAGKITKPIVALTDRTRIIAKGNFDNRIHIRTGDEIEELYNHFNNMATSLRKSYTDMEHEIEERTKGERLRSEQLRAINDIGRKISSFLSVDSLLPYVVNSLRDTFKYYDVNIFLLEPDINQLMLKASAGRLNCVVPIGSHMNVNEGMVGWVFRSGVPLLANNVRLEPAYRFIEELADTQSELTVPIKIGAKVVGVLDIQSVELNTFNEMDQFTAITLADQISIALENARLYREARKIATIEERARIARDLHDAVTQTLFSTSLIAEVIPSLWERQPDEAKRYLMNLQTMTRGALAEMRTLLLELHPSALKEVNIKDLLYQLTSAISNRACMPVALELKGECLLPPKVNIAIYRIAQEALSNIAKHSGASQAWLQLQCRRKQVRLVIRDNGRGFNEVGIKSDHLGLKIMHERADSIGASLNIRSKLNRGTEVIVVWSST